jgi:hypothetical protein
LIKAGVSSRVISFFDGSQTGVISAFFGLHWAPILEIKKGCPSVFFSPDSNVKPGAKKRNGLVKTSG